MSEEFEITITSEEPPAGGTNVTARYAQGIRMGAFRLHAVADAVTALRTLIRQRTPAAAALVQAGTALFNALFTDAVGEALRDCMTLATARNTTIRLRIYSELPAVIAIPWEYLYDARQQRWLALQADLSLVRGLPLRLREPQPVADLLRVLVMVSDPSDLPSLNSADERAKLEAATTTAAVELIPVAPTYAALQEALRQQPHVFHFIGHGAFANPAEAAQAGARHFTLTSPAADSANAPQGLLAFCHPDGSADLVDADRLAPLLASCASLGLVVLNACEGAVTGAQAAFAGLTQRLLQQGIPAVIAMQAPIFDEHALHFSGEFYAALADGYAIEQAVGEGRRRIHEVAYTWGIPAFYLQANEPFAVPQLTAAQKADRLWHKAQQTADLSARRRLLEGALALVPHHAGAEAALAQLTKEAEAAHLYAAAVAYMANEQWRDAHRALEQVEKRVSNYRDARSRLAEVLGKLPAEQRTAPADNTEQMEQYRPIFNALEEGRLTIFLGGEVGRIGRPPGDGWVEGLYPPAPADAAYALSRYLPPELQEAASLLQVSQYTQLLDGDYALYQRLSTLYAGDFTPTVLHRLLAELPARLATKGYPKTPKCRYVLFSTALDDLLERAFVEAGQPFHLFAYRPRFVDDDGVVQVERFLHVPPATDPTQATESEAIEVLEPNKYSGHDGDTHPIIVKLCGRRVTAEPDSVVVTEDQYMNYVSAEKTLAVLPTTLLTQIKRNSFLFFGHSLQAWHLRMLWQRLRLPSGDRQPPKWAIVPEPTRIEETFWRSQRIEPIVAQPEGVVAYVNNWLESL